MNVTLKNWIGKNSSPIQSLVFAVITTASLLLQENLDIPWNYLYQQYGNFVRENMNKKIVFRQFDFTMFIFFCLVWYFYFKALDKGLKFNRFPWMILSFLYSVCMLIGYGFYYAGGLDFYVSGVGNFFKTLLILGGYYVLFYIILYQTEVFLSTYSIRSATTPGKSSFVKRWFFILVMWLPYMILKYPGANTRDASVQFDYWCGYSESSPHGNPPLTTIIFGTCIEFGEKISNVSFGLFFYNVLQAMIMAACFAIVINYLYEKGIKKIWVNTYTVMVAVLPIYPIYATTMVKDNLYSMGLMLYIVMLVEMMRSRNAWFNHLKYRIIYFVSVFMMCTFRFNGKYIVFIVTIVLFIYFLAQKQNYKQSLLSFGVMTILMLLISWENNYFLYDVIEDAHNENIVKEVDSENTAAAVNMNGKEAANASTRDKAAGINSEGVLDLNLRCQMARLVCKYSDELSDTDIENINLFLDYDKVSEYNPQLMDSVSHIARYCSEEERNLVMDTWRKYFAKHPLTYIEAILHKSYGFFYPGAANYWNYWAPQNSMTTERLYFHAPERLSNLLRRFKVLVEDAEKLPFIYILENIGIAFWIILYCIFIMISKRKWRYVIPILPILINFGITLLGPSFYQSPRYGYPQVYLAPFLLMWGIKAISQRELEITCDDIGEKIK